MKVFTKPADFTPVHIVLETPADLDRFVSIIDKLDAQDFSEDEYKIVTHLSGAFTNMVGLRG